MNIVYFEKNSTMKATNQFYRKLFSIPFGLWLNNCFIQIHINFFTRSFNKVSVHAASCRPFFHFDTGTRIHAFLGSLSAFNLIKYLNQRKSSFHKHFPNRFYSNNLCNITNRIIPFDCAIFCE